MTQALVITHFYSNYSTDFQKGHLSETFTENIEQRNIRWFRSDYIFKIYD